MGVHERSTPYSCTVCRNASWATPSQPIPARNSGTLGLGNSPCYSAPWGQRRRRSDLQPSQHQISSADLQSSSLAFPENSPPQACCFNLLQGRADSFITDLGIHFKCHESHAALPLPFLSPWLGSCGCLILSSCWIYLAPSGAPLPFRKYKRHEKTTSTLPQLCGAPLSSPTPVAYNTTQREGGSL